MGERGSRGGWAGGQGHRGAWTAEGQGSPPQHWLPGDTKSPGGPTYHLERQGDFVEMWEEPQAGEPLGRRGGVQRSRLEIDWHWWLVGDAQAPSRTRCPCWKVHSGLGGRTHLPPVTPESRNLCGTRSVGRGLPGPGSRGRAPRSVLCGTGPWASALPALRCKQK